MKDKVAVFCAGYLFDIYCEILEQKYNIICLIDNDSQKWGQLYHGYKCLSFENAILYNISKIIIATKNINIIKNVKEQIYSYNMNFEILYIDDLIQNEIELSNSNYQDVYHDEFNNCIMIETGVVFNKINICFQGSNNLFKIGRNVKIETSIYVHFMGNGNTFLIGQNTFIGSIYVILAESGEVRIGNDCMIASEIDIYQGTSHPIFDKDTEKRINYSKDISIGDSVWIGKRVALMSGFSIGNGSVIGYGSVSSGDFGDNLIIAGCPAKVIRKDIIWKKDYVGLYKLDAVNDSK